MARLYPQGLLLLVLLVVISECGDIIPVTAYQEEDVALPCFNSNEMDPKSCYRVKWIKRATEKVILVRPKTSKIPDAERVKWEPNGNGGMSLFVTKLRQSDEGQYNCEIWQGWECILVKNISLQVRECKVLPAVKKAHGTSVNLTCPVSMTPGQQGPQNISWVMLKGENSVPINSNMVTTKGTSLAIESVIHSDSGWYRCKYILGETRRCFDMNLQVQGGNAVLATNIPAQTTSEKTRKEGSSVAFIAVVATVIIAIAISAALIGLFMYRRCNTQRAAQQTQSHPADTHMECVYGYEIVDLTLSDDSTNQRLNSLYQPIQHESLYSFHY